MRAPRGYAVALVVACCFWAAFFAAAVGIARADGPAYEPPAEIASEPPAPEGQPTCPDLELEPFEGEDVAAGEVRSLRGEAATSCAALTNRLDRLRERLWWVVAEALEAREQRSLTNEKLTALVEGAAEPQEVTVSEALPVADAALAESSSAVEASVDASGEAVKAGVYLVAGILAGLVIAGMLWRTWTLVG